MGVYYGFVIVVVLEEEEGVGEVGFDYYYSDMILNCVNFDLI